MVSSWAVVTRDALLNLWQAFLNYIPMVFGAILVLVIGWFVATIIGKLIAEILKRIKFDQIFEKGGWKAALSKAEIKVDPSGFIGAIIKWILIIVFLMAAIQILGIDQLADFLKGILGYLPNVIAAAAIFVVTVILVDIVEKVVRTAVESFKVGYGQVVSVVVKWSLWVFAILAILTQLKFEAADWIMGLINTAFMGLVAMIALAFGLGGKEVAAEILQELKKKLKE